MPCWWRRSPTWLRSPSWLLAAAAAPTVAVGTRQAAWGICEALACFRYSPTCACEGALGPRGGSSLHAGAVSEFTELQRAQRSAQHLAQTTT